MMKENEFAKKLTKGLRDCNAEVLSVVGNRMQQGAWPDVYIAHTFYKGWVEFKGLRTVLRQDQKIKIRKLKERGAKAFVVRCPNRIQDETGKDLKYFDGTAVGLLITLLEIENET